MNLLRIAALLAATIVPTAAFAAADPKEAPPVSSEPQNTAATYAEWTLRCTRTDDGARACDVTQQFQIQVQGQQAPFGQLLIGHVGKEAAMHVAFVVNPNVAFPSDVRLMTDEKDTQPVVLNWSSCVPSACRADGEFKDDQLKRWKALTANGRLVFKAAAGQLVPITVSVRGLAQALDALPKG